MGWVEGEGMGGRMNEREGKRGVRGCVCEYGRVGERVKEEVGAGNLALCLLKWFKELFFLLRYEEMMMSNEG